MKNQEKVSIIQKGSYGTNWELTHQFLINPNRLHETRQNIEIRLKEKYYYDYKKSMENVYDPTDYNGGVVNG